jgi:hypothetical protein
LGVPAGRFYPSARLLKAAGKTEKEERKNMSATETKKATAATSETIAELFQEAMRSYEKALTAGIQLQEESVNLWKYLFTKLDSAEELQAKFESAEVFPKGCAVPVFPATEIAMARKAAMEQEL